MSRNLILLNFCIFIWIALVGCHASPSTETENLILISIIQETPILSDSVLPEDETTALVNFSAYDRYGDIISYGAGYDLLEMEYSYELDNTGNLSILSWHNGDGTLKSKHTYRYNEHNDLSLAEEFDSTGTQISSYMYKYVYDEQGYINEFTVCWSDGSLTRRHLLYDDDDDDDGNRTNESIYDSTSDANPTITISYDQSGKEFEELLYSPNGILYSTKVHNYDSNGNLVDVSETRYDDTLLHSTTYSNQDFDERGNWTKRLVTNSIVPQSKEYHLTQKTAEYRQLIYRENT